MKDNPIKFNNIYDNASVKLFVESIADTVREPLVVLDSDLRVIFVNDSFYDYFNLGPSDSASMLIYDLRDGILDIPDLRRLLEDVLPRSLIIKDFEITHHFEGIGKKTLSLNARMVDIQDHDPDIHFS